MSTYDIRRKAADAIGVLPWATYESPEYMRTLDRVTAALERAYAAGLAAQSAGTAVDARKEALREAAVAVAMIMPTVFSESIGGFIRQSLAVEAIERLARAAPPLPPGGAAGPCGSPCMFCRGEYGTCTLPKGHPERLDGDKDGVICRCAAHPLRVSREPTAEPPASPDADAAREALATLALPADPTTKGTR